MKPVYSVTIPGRVAILKNGKRIFGRGRFKKVLPSEKYLAWKIPAIYFIDKAKTGPAIDGLLEAHFKFYFKNNAHEVDTSNAIEGPSDLLQEAGVIIDDKQIKKIIAEKFFGEEPRTEIELFRYENAD